MGGFQHRQWESGTFLTAAAPFIVTLVGVRREELLNQVGVGAVDFHAVKAGLDGATYRLAKFTDHLFHFLRGQSAGRCGAVTWGGDGAWANRCAAADQRRFHHTAAVINLQHGFGAFGLNRLGDFTQPGDFVVAVDAEGARERQAFIINKGAFNNDRPNAAGAFAVVFHQFTGDTTVKIPGAGRHWRH